MGRSLTGIGCGVARLARRAGTTAVCVTALACSTASSPAPEGEPPAERTARDRLDQLEDPEAQQIVEEVLEDYDLAEICAQGVDRVKTSVRKSVITVMFSSGLSSPRDSGTAAGHFIAEQCREINPDY